MEKKSSKMIAKSTGQAELGTHSCTGRLRRFLSAYDNLAGVIKKRFDTEGDAIGAYIGKLGAVMDIPYRDELMIRLVRCREIKNKFTRGEISGLEYAVSEEDISALLSLTRRISRSKDPVSHHTRGVIASRIRRYSNTAVYIAGAVLILLLSAALFFAIKY